MNYDLPEGELRDLAYIFEAPDQGIDEGVAETLRQAIDVWQQELAHSRLSYTDLGDELLLRGKGVAPTCGPPGESPSQSRSPHSMKQPRTISSLAARLGARATMPTSRP